MTRILGNNYGQILGIYLEISSIDENKVSNIEQIKIDISNNDEPKKNSLSAGEVNVVKEFLMDIYGIDKNKIHIN